MQGTIHDRRRWRLALVVVAGGLTAACSTYRPLDHGSRVPWARADETPGQTAAAGRGSFTPAAASLPADRYVVQRGDRLGSLASYLGVSVHALAGANRLKPPYVIYVGQTLRIPEGGQGARPGDREVAARDVQVVQLGDVQVAAVAPAAGPAEAPDASSPGEAYVVRRGETLWSISKRVDVSMTELAAVNELPSPYHVFVGQKLRIPGPDGAAEMTASQKIAAPRHGTEPPPLTGRGFVWPVNGKVIGGFGQTRQGQKRDGIDVAAREGAPVLAAEDGLVAYAGDGIPAYGRLIILRHGDGYITTYGHNAALLVEVGELVERGQVIARVGSTGNAPRSMLHFELRKGRKPIDPEAVLVREPTAVASTE